MDFIAFCQWSRLRRWYGRDKAMDLQAGKGLSW